MSDVLDKLFDMQDAKYKEFISKLVPNISPDNIIGIKTPPLRAYAKELYKAGLADEFLLKLPHRYLEENNLHGYLIEQIKDFEQCIAYLDAFLPYVDNWATCDTMRPKCFKKNTDRLLEHINRWIVSKDTYAIRFAIEMLMVFYLDDDFQEKYLEQVAAVRSDEYYINMMIAWYFATALAKQYESAVKYIENNRLIPWIHNKTIQKAKESFRITKERKEYLNNYKIKRLP